MPTQALIESKRKLALELMKKRLASKPKRYPLSIAQERLWFLEQLAPGNAAYHIPSMIKLSGPMSVPALVLALEELVQRHSVLRTRFPVIEGRAMQEVLPAVENKLQVLPLESTPPDERRSTADRYMAEDVREPFPLASEAPLRVKLLRFDEREHYLLLCMHHIVSDGWSTAILVKELLHVYESRVKGTNSQLPILEIQYADYAVWQRNWLQGDVLDKQLGYWQTCLAGLQPLELPADFTRPSTPSYRGGWKRFSVDAKIVDRVKRLGRELSVTVFMALLGCLQILLKRYTGQDDISIGAPIANRNRSELESLIGFFVNTIVLRTNLSGDPTFREALNRARETTLGAYTHQDLPFEKLVEGRERDLSRNPLCQVALMLQDPIVIESKIGGLAVEDMCPELGGAKFDISFTFTQENSMLSGEIEYAADVFAPETIERMARHFVEVLDRATANPDLPISHIQLVTAGERTALIEEWAGEYQPSAGKTIIDVLEEQERRTPDAIAVVSGSAEWSYEQLHRESNRLARVLRENGVGTEVRVGICLRRSEQIVAALLATLKAGGVYVPLDPEYPEDRLAYMLADSAPAVLITESGLAGRFNGSGVPTLQLDTHRDRIASASHARLARAIDERNAAYMLYTSGSTGRPKGVVIEHRSTVALMEWALRTYSSKDLKAVLFSTSVCFDLSVFEVFVTLARGGQVVIAPNLLEWDGLEWDGAGLSLINSVPSVVAEWCKTAKAKLPEVVNLAGEPLPKWLADRLFASMENGRILNLYGPTECTTYSTVAEVERDRTPDIGRPIQNTQVYVLDERHELVPVGVAGELYIGGAGVGRGYWRRAGLTAERFVPSPFSEREGERLYRTGDLVRWRNDGNLEYLGRMDQQIKIHGFRIELGEVETVLCNHPWVDRAAAIVREDTPGNKRLVAYWTARETNRPTQTQALREFLRARLPAHMVPAAFVLLEELPLSANGKLDRRALPAPEVDQTGYVAPRTAIEEILAGVFGAVLGIDRVGADANFFELGGHSLLATQVVSRIKKALDIDLPLRVLFERPTVRGLAEAIRGALLEPVAAASDDAPPLSFGQQRLWFIGQFDPNSAAYNIAASFRLRGELSPEFVKQSLREIVQRHETLRTSFVSQDGRPIQRISVDVNVECTVIALDSDPDSPLETSVEDRLISEMRRPFDLAHGSLFRAVLVKSPSGKSASEEHHLLLCTHQAVCDAWSLGLLIEDFAEVYDSLRSGEGPRGKAPGIRYADYAAWQRHHLSAELFDKELNYWRTQLSGLAPLRLPGGNARLPVLQRRAARKAFSLAPELLDRLTDVSRSSGSSVFITLLAGLKATLGRFCGQSDLAVGTITPNRNRAEIENLVGPIANTLVLRTDLSGDPTVRELLSRVRSTLLDAYAHQEIPYEKLIEDLDPARDLNRQPLFQVMCTWTDVTGDRRETGGLIVSRPDIRLGEANHDLAFHFVAGEEVLRATVEYPCDLFESSIIDNLLESYVRVLTQLPERLDTNLSSLRILSHDDKTRLLAQSLSSQSAPWLDKGVADLFEEQAAATPNALAVTADDRQLTYRELNEDANRLAHFLRAHSVGPEVRVGICLERSALMLTAVIAVLKAGGAYVPLDPAYPAERLELIGSDSQLSLTLTRADLETRLPVNIGTVVALDVVDGQIGAQPISNPHRTTGPESLAYIMYTSGSTGKPKGAGIAQRGIVRLVKNAGYAHLDAGHVILQLAPISFDASTFEIWGSLLNGGHLVMPPPGASSLEEIAHAISRYGITTMWLTAGLFHRMAEEHPAALGKLRQLLAGGDSLSLPIVKKLLAQNPSCKLINGYGPTENTTFSCCCELNQVATWPGSTPIGTPIGASSAYVLDEWMQPSPVGAPGELFVGGSGLARGYVGQPSLTAECFVPNPFSELPGERIYRTRDKARWLPDGNIEFLGRFDEQVKIRGFRVEPGEIESVLSEHPHVSKVLVVAREDSPQDKRLVAYVTMSSSVRTTAQNWRDYVLARLPEYLCPSAFVQLGEMPLTANGKIDRRALPAPEWHASDRYVAPGNLDEEMLCGIWEQVLKIARVGVNDNFFELGGHSMLATQVISRVRKLFGVEAPLRLLFDSPTITGFALALQALRLNTQVQAPSIAPVDRSGDLPLSSAQGRLWFIEQLGPGTALYNMPFALKIRGELEIATLHRTLNEIVRRHEVLRTCYPSHNGEPVQRILTDWDLPMPVTDISANNPEDRTRRSLDMIREQASRGFDLEHGPVVYFRLLRLADDEHILILAIHHIAGDGWSMGVLTKELASLYGALSAGLPSPLPEPYVQYGDFSVWQRNWLSGPMLDEQLEYWRNQLVGVPVLDLPTDHTRPSIPTHRGATCPIRIPAQLTNQLRRLSQQQGASLFMTLLAAFNVLLSRYSRQKDVAVGSVIANRNRAEVEDLIGFFVNTLVLRTDLSGEPDFVELLQRVRQTALDAYARQDIPFERLVQELEPNRDLSRQPLFQVMFVLQNTPKDVLKLGPLEVTEMEVPQSEAKFDLSLTLIEVADGLEGEIDYSLDLFEPASIDRMAATYLNILEAAASGRAESVFTTPLLGHAERTAILDAGAAAVVRFAEARCIHELFADRAVQNPSSVALVHGDAGITYNELNSLADRVAARLVDLGVREESLVAVCLERGVEMVVAMLAILKAGGAYVPLDPDYPQDRLDFVLTDTKALVLITNEDGRDRFSNCNGALEIVSVDDLANALVTGSDCRGSLAAPGNAAYVIYTSGSTGQPKGVVVTHENVVRLFQATESQYGFSEKDVWTLFHSYAFDFSVWEMWGALLFGGTLVIVSRAETRSPELFHDLLDRHGVTILNQTPSAFRQLQQVDSEREGTLQVRAVICGGEALDPSLVGAWHRKHTQSQLVNMYGITETTVHTTYKLLSAEDIAVAGKSPIGEPLADLQLYVLDDWLEPVPGGVAGEIYVGGPGLARGYLARPELTASRFIPNPYAVEPGERLYRTGDLGRRRSSGVEYAGRADEQVKIRGFRIELGEIEAVLRRCDGVRDAAVIVREDIPGDKQLVAYLTGFGSGPLPLATIRAGISESLPAYMLPAAFVGLERLPLTPNGKLNRRALAKPGRSGEERGLAPQTATQDILCGVWREVLGLDRVAIEANFFEIGGHSLLATQVVSRARRLFGVDIPLRLLFEKPTIQMFAEVIDLAVRSGAGIARPELRRAARSADLPLSYAQQRLWLVEQLAPGTSAYHIAGTVRLSGEVDVEALTRSFAEIVKRHEALRTTFHSSDGRPVQHACDRFDFELCHLDISAAPLAQAEKRALETLREEAQRPFDLEHDLLLRVTLAKLAEREFRLLVCMHHLASDGWSVGVLMREFAELYRAHIDGRQIALSDLPVQYADYAAWQRSWLDEQDLAEQLSFWRRQLEGLSHLELPIDHPRPAIPGFRGGWKPFQIGEDLAKALKAVSQAHGCTLFMTLLGALQALLGRYTGQSDIAVGSPIAGRDLAELEPLIGFFVNTLVLRGDLSGDPTFAELLSRVRKVTLGAYAHQMLPFEKLVETLQPERDLAHQPLFQVAFALQNGPSGDLDLPHLRMGEMEALVSAAKFDLTVALNEHDCGIDGEIEYAAELFEPETIERFASLYVRVLEQLSRNANLRLSELRLLPEDELERSIKMGAGETAYFPRQTVHSLFESQAAKTPDCLAIVSDGQEISYSELNDRSTKLARHLRALGVNPGSYACICLERSPELIVAMLAVLKAGGVYVPLDHRYPVERLAMMLADTAAKVVITNTRLSGSLPEAESRVVNLDTLFDASFTAGTEDFIPTEDQDAAAYVNYTSGSTGLPKGVVVPHRSIVRLVSNTNYIQFRGSERVAHASNVSFDAATFEIWGPLLHGAAISIIPFDVVLEPVKLAQRLVKDRITTLFVTTALFNRMVDECPEALAGLETLLFGGEAVDPRRVETLVAGHFSGRLLHVYGPTETTTFATHHLVRRASYGRTVPVGTPISNTSAYVLDDGLNIVPPGLNGELYLGGPGLADGYLKRGEITAERFLPDPFSFEPGQRLYRTGDVVRRRADGEIEFVGRRDNQVKIRGFRIELTEIEFQMLAHPEIGQAAVIAHEHGEGDKRIAAYFASRDGASVSTSKLRAFLKERLPEYMLPQLYIQLEMLPLTATGKTDRRNLPLPEIVDATVGKVEAPETPAEEIVLGIWLSVLGLASAGLDDNFFELGGHSLLATQVLSRIRAAFGDDVPLRLLFERPTVRTFSSAIQSRLSPVTAASERVTCGVNPGQNIPLSFAQQRLWFTDQWEPGNTAYNISSSARLEGTLSVSALERTLQEIVRRHEVLRTRFDVFDGEPVQIVQPLEHAGFVLDRMDLRSDPRKQERLRLLMRAQTAQPFDLREGRMLRACLLWLAEDESVLLLTMHHIVSDGWSMGVLVREIGMLYQSFGNGAASPLPELPVQYANYSVWQRNYLNSELLEGHLAYWRNQLANLPVLEIPTDYPRPAERSRQGASVPLEVSTETSTRLKELARREGVTLYMVLLASFQLVLAKWSGQNDIAIGSPIANRTRAEIENLIGFFVNTLVLRGDLSGDPSVRELLGRVREVCLGAYAHQELPFERLVEALNPERSLNTTPLFQVMFTLQNAPFSALAAGELRVSLLPPETKVANFDLSLELIEEDGALKGIFEYTADLFDSRTIERAAAQYVRVLEQFGANPGTPLSQIALLDERDKMRLTDGVNRPLAAYVSSDSLVSRFETQVANTPNRIAVVFDDRSLTYSDLNRQADALALRLLKQGIADEQRIAICLEPSTDLAVAVIAVLKTGAAYVPLDPDYPQERLLYTIEDANVSALITRQTLLDRVPHRNTILIDSGTVVEPESLGLHRQVNAENAAYVIYTSGSTGRPKGVVVTHANVLRLFDSTHRWFHFGEADTWTLFHSYAFDFSVWEFFGALLHGGKLVIPAKHDTRSPDAFYSILETHRVTVLNQTPSAFRQLQEVDRSRRQALALRCVIFGGEQLDPHSLAPWSVSHPECRLINMYGITETTVHTTYRHLCPEDLAVRGRSPIGQRLPDLELYVLDEWLQPVPEGAAGEIYVGGPGLARGYLNRPDLTADRFVPHPYSEVSGSRLYRSGDLARWRSGTPELDYLGRADQQVKIRGFRIELGEIEASLRELPGVRDAVVIAETGSEGEASGDKRLIAYVIGTPDWGGLQQLRGQLRARLPEHLTPSTFIEVTHFPLTTNGKLDRSALPRPEPERPELGVAYVAASTALEKALCDIWARVLRIERVGIHDDFFELGGHSLLATRIVSLVQESFGVQLPLRRLFETPTVAGIAHEMMSDPAGTERIEATAELIVQLAEFSEEEVAEMLQTAVGDPIAQVEERV